tara:strand:+ start:6917 stop:7684 length:768 start_codon:yes stop_codon:yes gene_type:complete
MNIFGSDIIEIFQRKRIKRLAVSGDPFCRIFSEFKESDINLFSSNKDEMTYNLHTFFLTAKKPINFNGKTISEISLEKPILENGIYKNTKKILEKFEDGTVSKGVLLNSLLVSISHWERTQGDWKDIYEKIGNWSLQRYQMFSENYKSFILNENVSKIAESFTFDGIFINLYKTSKETKLSLIAKKLGYERKNNDEELLSELSNFWENEGSLLPNLYILCSKDKEILIEKNLKPASGLRKENIVFEGEELLWMRT